MIPAWLGNGDLPPGVHFAQLAEVAERLAFNPRRRRLIAGFHEACDLLRLAGCRLVYLDGSFVTAKRHPGDFDACWDIFSGISRTDAPRRNGGSEGSFSPRSCRKGLRAGHSSSSSRSTN